MASEDKRDKKGRLLIPQPDRSMTTEEKIREIAEQERRKVTMNFRLTAGTRTKVKYLALVEGRTVSNWLDRLINRAWRANRTAVELYAEVKKITIPMTDFDLAREEVSETDEKAAKILQDSRRELVSGFEDDPID